jgi:hypothetical protein
MYPEDPQRAKAITGSIPCLQASQGPTVVYFRNLNVQALAVLASYHNLPVPPTMCFPRFR